MNKRDFIVQGSGTLLAGVATSTWAAHATDASATPGTPEASTATQAGWQALLGQAFNSQTKLGRPVTLTVIAVDGQATDVAAPGLTQFTVSFQGPRALPLKAGLHQLSHTQAGQVQLYLEPVPQGEHIHYDAHFSLLR
ncbi:MAG: hypothetical protein HY836_05560 [Aquabacterium sp.]|uniref:DUF6916 family protein n=1 Tax=Aquabacterium sp. TaxID=1872578 RepID=UPI0025C3145D|nr:hypothetical protein [Aquabacterium sp.]MBI5925048.1 hypothetical protein [Aquabacterium sp.]